MTRIENLSRRDVLKGTGAATAFVLGASLAPGGLMPRARAADGAF